MLYDRTRELEQDVITERTPKTKHLLKLFAFCFSSTKLISTIYLCAFIILSLLRPVSAFVWGRYITAVQATFSEDIILPSFLLLIAYFVINFLADLIMRYVYLHDEMEQLNIVQANRQQEKLYARMYKKLASVSPEYFEVPKINDSIEQVLDFTTAKVGGLNTSVMLQSYVVIAKLVSVSTIAASLYIFNPWLCLIVLLAPIPTIWSRTIGQKLKFEFMKNNTKLLRKASYFQGLMLGGSAKEIKTLGLHDFFYNKWKDAIDEYTIKEKKLIRAQSKFLILNYSVMSFTTVMGNIFAIVLMAMGQLSMGALGAVMSLVSTLVNDTKELLTGLTTFTMKKNEAA